MFLKKVSAMGVVKNKLGWLKANVAEFFEFKIVEIPKGEDYGKPKKIEAILPINKETPQLHTILKQEFSVLGIDFSQKIKYFADSFIKGTQVPEHFKLSVALTQEQYEVLSLLLEKNEIEYRTFKNPYGNSGKTTTGNYRGIGYASYATKWEEVPKKPAILIVREKKVEIK